MQNNYYFRRNINGKHYYAWNPLPDTSTKELRDKADVSKYHAVNPDTPFFEVIWQYSAGPERETVFLKPGEKILLDEEVADSMMLQMRERGIVLLSEEHDDEEKAAKRREGLRQAQQFYRRVGKVRVQAFMVTQGIDEAKLELYRHELWKNFENQAAADLLEECMLNAEGKAQFTPDEDGDSDSLAGDRPE